MSIFRLQYLQIKLTFFQKVILKMSNKFIYFRRRPSEVVLSRER